MTKSLKLTPWYPGHIKPVRKGVYQQMCGKGLQVGYQLWDGSKWHTWVETPEAAAQASSLAHGLAQNDKWRGVAHG